LIKKVHHKKLPKRVLLIIAAILYTLSFATSYYLRANPSITYEQKQLQHYIQEREKNFQTFLKDTVLLAKLVSDVETQKEFETLIRKDYGIYLYEPNDSSGLNLLFWNNQFVLPPVDTTHQSNGTSFKTLANGLYVLVKQPVVINNKEIHCFATIPVLYKFDFQQSSYLQTHFAYNKEAHKKIIIAGALTDFPVVSHEGNTLFHIERRNTQLVVEEKITAFLQILSFVLILAFIHFFVISVRHKYGKVKGVLLLTLFLVSLRILLFIFPVLFSLRQFELFDPTIYSTNWLHRSLGDLLLDAFFFCWIVVFIWYGIGPLKKLPYFIKGRWVKIWGIGALFILILSTFQLAQIVRSLVADSQISFNVTDFFSLNYFSVIGFLVLALLSLSYFYFSRILFRFIFPVFENQYIYIYFSIAVTGLILLTLDANSKTVLFQLPILLWLVIYTLLVSQEQFIINRFKVTIAGILFWIFIFSVSLAGVILQENKERELRIRKGIAEKYDQLTDPAGERTMSIALAYLDNDYLKNNFKRFSDPQNNTILRDSIIRENFSGYINKYETKLFVFDDNNKPVNNTESLSFTELNNLYTEQSRATGIKDLNYYETSYDEFIYITKRVVQDGGLLGTLFIVSTPKRYNQDAIYPELFRRINDTDPENSPIYSYAVYKNKLLTAASSKYPFRINLTPQEVPKQEYQRIVQDGYDELWYRASSNKVVVVAKKQNTFIESITLFSYLFCAFLFLVALLQMLALLLKAGEDLQSLNVLSQLNIRSQVHSTIIFISILSFLVIGAATISFFINRYNRNNVDKLSRTAGIMVKEMQKRLLDYSTFDDVVKIFDPLANADLKSLIEDVSDIHDVDVNVYDLEGNLKVSSEEEVYARGILSDKMHPNAFYHLQRLRQVQFVQEESMSSLNYLSIYAAIRDDEGKVYAYLNIPYFLSEIDINQEISNFLVTIINLNAFIFLLAGVIALFITNRITRSFSIIGDKMKEIQLGKTNEEIVWNRNDEIGELVKQYNKMVHQLEESAAALAKSEREGAWREMARQVAHEIKNPLTPMKLSIQYLQKAITNNQPNVQQLTTSVANTLVEQIDHLSKIAADFARFANIGIRQLEYFDLHAVIENLKELYSTNPKVHIVWDRLTQPVMIHADKTHMNRLFTNLITNSVDACIENSICKISITEELSDEQILIRISDNGEGIPEEMHDRIFTPNFTTKTSGTGLGLAMSKSIVEQAGGTIWFKTEKGKGTTFFVQLPLDNSPSVSIRY
jgi:signal transduction histidine kinase